MFLSPTHMHTFTCTSFTDGGSEGYKQARAYMLLQHCCCVYVGVILQLCKLSDSRRVVRVKNTARQHCLVQVDLSGSNLQTSRGTMSVKVTQQSGEAHPNLTLL